MLWVYPNKQAFPFLTWLVAKGKLILVEGFWHSKSGLCVSDLTMAPTHAVINPKSACWWTRERHLAALRNILMALNELKDLLWFRIEIGVSGVWHKLICISMNHNITSLCSEINGTKLCLCFLMVMLLDHLHMSVTASIVWKLTSTFIRPHFTLKTQ